MGQSSGLAFSGEERSKTLRGCQSPGFAFFRRGTKTNPFKSANLPVLFSFFSGEEKSKPLQKCQTPHPPTNNLPPLSQTFLFAFLGTQKKAKQAKQAAVWPTNPAQIEPYYAFSMLVAFRMLCGSARFPAFF